MRTTELRACTLVAALLAPFTAHAQSDPERAVARDLFREGDALQRSGYAADALEHFKRAQALVAAPTNLVRIAECEAAIGHLVRAAEIYREAIRFVLPPKPPAAFSIAQDQAKVEIADVEARTPRLTLAVGPADAPNLAIAIDDRSINVATLGEPTPIDPGRHKIVVSATGYATARRTITLAERDTKKFSIALGAGDVADDTSSTSSTPIAAYVAFGVGGVGVVLGSIFGVLALNDHSTLESACKNGTCPASSASDISALHTNGWISNVGLALGVVGVGVGTVLLLTSNGSRSESADGAARTPHVTGWIGAGAAGIGGTFQ